MTQRSLICMTTCNRANAVRALVWDYLRFCSNDDRFDFLLSLDGKDPQTLRYCRRHGIPVLYSQRREGVGLSKNRVLQAYPKYASYFFVEDDVALLDPGVFQIHIEVAQASGIPHFSLFPEDRLIEEVDSTTTGPWTIRHGRYGGGAVSFFTRAGIDVVGGFDLRFAELRRFGHTEHSYRFVHAGLCRHPFNVIAQCMTGYVRWTEPGRVTRVRVEMTQNRLYRGEADLIARQQRQRPIATLSAYRKPDSLDLGAVHPDRYRHIHELKYRAWVGGLNALRALKRCLPGRGRLRERGAAAMRRTNRTDRRRDSA